MSDDLSSLETELKTLRPRLLAPGVAERLAACAPGADAGTRRTAAVVWLWPALGAAAAVAVFVAGRWMHSAPAAGRSPATVPVVAAVEPPRSAPGRMVPVRAVNHLFGASSGCPVRIDDRTAVRPVRLRYVDTITWRDPSGNGSLQCTVPREEVFFVPVVAY